MIVDTVAMFESGSWRVELSKANYRPERHSVHLCNDEMEQVWCVGFADDPGQAEELFLATVRTVQVLIDGDAESADWMELPPGTPPFD